MKALVGSWDHRPYQLVAEMTALRSRIAELERELERARAENAALRAERDRQISLEEEREVALSAL